ncbi:LAFA_0E16160g1_1 [Lachancea sp. 'fantastica']|nr:LAFA_0E16160g1_1 [Lachancea sp. 'fantastica']
MLFGLQWQWKLLILLWTSVATAESGCDLTGISKRSETLRYEEAALPEYSQLIAQLDKHCKGQEAQQLRIQLLYKSGLIQVSSGNELAAVGTFETVQESAKSTSSPFASLAHTRLQEIYRKFGFWHALEDLTVSQHYDTLKKSVLAHLEHDKPVPVALREEFQNLAPFALESLILANDALYIDLSQSLSINAGQSIFENYKTVLSKHKKSISVSDKLKIHHAIAVLQLFVLATPPTALMNCLALDMEYKPCRDLSKISSRINKVSPSLTALTHPDQFLSLHGFDWNRLQEFYVAKSVKPISSGDPIQGSTNLDRLQALEKKLLQNLLHHRPLSSISRHWNINDSAVSAFSVIRDLALCETYDQSSKPKVAETFCKRAAQAKLSPEISTAINAFSQKLQDVDKAKETLNSVWLDTPSLALHAIRNCVSFLASKDKIRNSMATGSIWALLETFAKDHGWEGSQNEAIAKLNRIIKIASAKKRKEGQERFQKQQHQQRQQQQQFFRHQQNSSPPPANDLSIKNLYKVLGLSKEASSKDIRKAYLAMTRKFHPDKQGQMSDKEKQENEEKMSKINEAYEILGDEVKRKDYDNQRADSGPQRQQSPFGARNGGFPFGANSFKMNFGQF